MSPCRDVSCSHRRHRRGVRNQHAALFARHGDVNSRGPWTVCSGSATFFSSRRPINLCMRLPAPRRVLMRIASRPPTWFFCTSVRVTRLSIHFHQHITTIVGMRLQLNASVIYVRSLRTDGGRNALLITRWLQLVTRTCKPRLFVYIKIR